VDHINHDNPNLSTGDEDVLYLKKVIYKIGHYPSLRLVVEAEERNLKNHTTFQKFLDLAQQKGYLTSDDLLDMKNHLKERKKKVNRHTKSM
jgi:hypothetical protein